MPRSSDVVGALGVISNVVNALASLLPAPLPGIVRQALGLAKDIALDGGDATIEIESIRSARMFVSSLDRKLAMRRRELAAKEAREKP